MYGLILAGAEGIGGINDLPYKAGFSLGNTTMLERAIAALTKVRAIEKIIVVGPEHLLTGEQRKKVWRVVLPGTSFFSNLKRGITSVPGDEPVLVVASDLPLITAEACDDFLKQCGSQEADLYYPVIPEQTYQESYPGSKRTYIGLSDGVFTGGNMVLMKTTFFRRHQGLIRLAINLRKHPWVLALRFGIGFWWHFRQKKVSLHGIEILIRKKYRIEGKAIVSLYSEIGFDLDTLEDVNWVRFYWVGIRDHWQRDEEEEEWLM